MLSTITFILCLSSGIAESSETEFDSQLQATNGELNGIMSGMETLDTQDAQQGVSLDSPTASGDSMDFTPVALAPEDTMELHLAQLQTRLQASNSLSQKLRGAVVVRDHEIKKAENLMKTEFDAIASTVKAKNQESGEGARLEAIQKSVQEHLDESKHQLQQFEVQARDEEAKRVSLGNDADKAHNELKIANDAEAADMKSLADFKEQSTKDSVQAAAKIQKLQATITAMQSQVAGGIAAHVHWEKNATALTQKLQESKAMLRSLLLAKQTSDVDMAQVSSRWKDSLTQLQRQANMNSQLKQRATQDGESVIEHLNDLKQSIHDRDERIAQLKQQLSSKR